MIKEFMEKPPKHYVRLCCEEIFRELEKEIDGLNYLKIEIFKCHGMFGIAFEGDTEDK